MSSSGQEVKILLADDHEMFRQGLRHLLQVEPDIEVVADTGDSDQVLALVRDHQPDILLMELNLRPSPGMQTLRELESASLPVRPILLTADIDNGRTVEALKLGVWGVVTKQSGNQLLLKCIRTVMAGQIWISRDTIFELVGSIRSLNKLLKHRDELLDRSLSSCENQIIRAIAYGYSNKEIAKELNVCEQTVKYHLSKIYSKLGVKTRMQLARYTVKHKLIREA